MRRTIAAHHDRGPEGLTEEQIGRFITDGYVRVDDAFPRRLVTQASEGTRRVLSTSQTTWTTHRPSRTPTRDGPYAA